MIGILLITHQPLASAFVAAAQHVFHHTPERLHALDVVADQAPDEVQKLACVAIENLDDGNGVLVLTDVLGATPCNCAQNLQSQTSSKIEVLSGISLPMLLRALSYRHLPLKEAAQKAVEGGQVGAQILQS